MRAATIAVVLLIARVASAEEGHGPELPPADIESAQAAGFQVIRFDELPSATRDEIDQGMLAPFLKQAGGQTDYGFGWTMAGLGTGSADSEVLVFALGADPLINAGRGMSGCAVRAAFDAGSER